MILLLVYLSMTSRFKIGTVFWIFWFRSATIQFRDFHFKGLHTFQKLTTWLYPLISHLVDLSRWKMGGVLVFWELWQNHVVNCKEMKLSNFFGLNVKLKNDMSKCPPMMTDKWEEKVLKCDKREVRSSWQVPPILIGIVLRGLRPKVNIIYKGKYPFSSDMRPGMLIAPWRLLHESFVRNRELEQTLILRMSNLILKLK